MQQLPSLESAGTAPAGATVLHSGRRVSLRDDGLAIGRRSDNDVVLPAEGVSRHHARIAASNGRWYVGDLDSKNGTYVNGECVVGESRWLESGDTIAVGSDVLRFVGGEATRFGRPSAPGVAAQVVQFAGRPVTLGRDPSNEVVLDDPNVSRFHAQIVPRAAGIELRDLDSSNGTRVDGRLVARAPVQTGSEIAIGPFRILFDGTSFLARNQSGALRLDAEKVGVEAGGRKILSPTSLTVLPGELVAIIG